MYLHFNEDIIHERFECNCSDLRHSMRFSYNIEDFGRNQLGEEVKYQSLSVELQATWWEQWYKRIWAAIKYIFRKKDYYYCGIDFDKKDDIIRMRNFLDRVLEQWKEQKGGDMANDQMDVKLTQKIDEFDRIVVRMRQIMIDKNNDYGNDNIGALGIKGIFVRIWDKVCRLKQLVWAGKENQVKDESVEDTYLDLANYAVISIIVKRGKWN